MVSAWARAATDRFEGPFGDVVGFCPVAVTCSVMRAVWTSDSNAWVTIPSSGRDRDLRRRPTREVNHGVRERFIHRHARFAVASEALAITQRLVQRFTEGAHHVFDGVVIAGLEVAHALESQVETRVKGELLEHVIVETRTGVDVARDPRPAPANEC